jgi:hypothetical protein
VATAQRQLAQLSKKSRIPTVPVKFESRTTALRVRLVLGRRDSDLGRDGSTAAAPNEWAEGVWDHAGNGFDGRPGDSGVAGSDPQAQGAGRDD